jgi:hypothetical protein
VRNVGNVGSRFTLCLLLATANSMHAQVTSEPQWIVGVGGGAVIRTVHQGSFGLNLQVARVVQPARAFYLEPGLIWQGYGSSPQSGDLCPIEGCPPPLENAISIIGPELRVAYREPEKNPVYPVAGVGLYRVSSQDTTGVSFGTNVGLGISLRRSGSGPALDFRYFHVFGDPRFKSAFPLALRWSF